MANSYQWNATIIIPYGAHQTTSDELISIIFLKTYKRGFPGIHIVGLTLA